jgi:hypothetical protein
MAHYGTQSDRVLRSMDTLSLRHVVHADDVASNADDALNNCGVAFYRALAKARDTLEDDRRLELDDAVDGTEVTSFDRVPFNLVVERSGESNYNILGLKGADAFPFLPKGRKKVVICLDPLDGWISFGVTLAHFSCVCEPPVYFPLERSRDYFTTSLLGLVVEYDDGTKVKVPHMPPQALWDTGSNMLTMPSNAFDALRELLVGSSGGPKIHLHFPMFEGLGETAVLTLHERLYTWEDGALLIEPDNSHASFVVVGSLLLQYFAVAFDEERGCVGLAKSKACDGAGCVLRRN